jgi:hypothetical protein
MAPTALRCTTAVGVTTEFRTAMKPDPTAAATTAFNASVFPVRLAKSASAALVRTVAAVIPPVRASAKSVT